MAKTHCITSYYVIVQDVTREVKEFVDSHGLENKMPTQKILKLVGRGDLLYGINKYGARRIAALTGLKLDSRGGHKHSVYKILDTDKGR